MAMSDFAKFDPVKMETFLQGASVLIIDSNSMSRPVIRKLMSALGARTANVIVAEGLEEARERISALRPSIVLCEYRVDDSTALELFDLFKANAPDRLRSAFIVLADGNSPALWASIAESEVDGLLLRPFTYNDLQKCFVDTVAPKVEPTTYLKLVEAARRFLQAGQHEQALTAAIEAQARDPYPAEACQIQGIVELWKGDSRLAVSAFSRALKLDPNHYRAKLGLIDALTRSNEAAAALDVALDLSAAYPVNPKRIPAFIRLCLQTERLSDIALLNDFVGVGGYEDEALGKHMAAGLVIYAKKLLAEGRREEALEIFRKAELASRNSPVVLREVVAALYLAGIEAAAEEVRRRLPVEVAESTPVQTAMLENLNLKGPHNNTLRFAQELMGRSGAEARVFEIAILQAVALARSREIVDELVSRASAAHPDRREEFERLRR
jgi:tetratricopeptide (TPR) repeat protein